MIPVRNTILLAKLLGAVGGTRKSGRNEEFMRYEVDGKHIFGPFDKDHMDEVFLQIKKVYPKNEDAVLIYAIIAVDLKS